MGRTVKELDPLVALLFEDRMMSRSEAERRVGTEIHWEDWRDAHVIFYRRKHQRSLAWTAKPGRR